LYQNFNVFIRYVISLVFAVVGYVVSYVPGLIHHPDLLDFLKFQRWLASWWAGNTAGQVGDIYNIIFTGSWKAWWTAVPTIIRVEEWNITWPVLATLGTTSLLKIIKTRNFKVFLLWLWPAMYLLFLTFTAPFPRYTVMLFPFWALLTVYMFKK